MDQYVLAIVPWTVCSFALCGWDLDVYLCYVPALG